MSTLGKTNGLSKSLTVYNSSQKEFIHTLVKTFCGTITIELTSYTNKSITYNIVSHYDVNFYTFLSDFFRGLKDIKEFNISSDEIFDYVYN